MQTNKHNKAGVIILITNKIDYKTKRYKEELSVMIKGQFTRKHNNHKCILSNNRDSKHMKQKSIELKGETDKPTIMAEDLNTALLALDRTRKKLVKTQKIRRMQSTSLT